MTIDMKEIAESLLWENVSYYVEQVKELKTMIGNIAYVDRDIIEKSEGELILCRVI